MKNLYEPFRENKESADRIQCCIDEIMTDAPEHISWFQEYARSQKSRIAFDYDLVKQYCKIDSVIVEIGSIPLLLTLPLKAEGFNIVGVDICPERFQSTIKRASLDVRKCNIEIERLPFPDNFCDNIIFNEIFEHLRINLIFTLREVYRVLRPGGRLFLSTRNLRSLVGIKNFLFNKIAQSGSTDIYREYCKLETLGHMGHVREYTTTEVANFLRNIGFQIEAVLYRGDYQSKFDQFAIRLYPRLRPYFTCIASKS